MRGAWLAVVPGGAALAVAVGPLGVAVEGWVRLGLVVALSIATLVWLARPTAEAPHASRPEPAHDATTLQAVRRTS